jgi:putative ABC transport system permease protein
VELNGRPIVLNQVPRGENRGLLAREYVLTYRPGLDANETILSGKFWDPSPGSSPEVSIEEVIARDLKLAVGDTMQFDVLGTKITARISSVRRVDWRAARTGFLILFRPGALEDAPQMLISAINGPPPGPARATLQREIVEKYPNVSVIDVFDILDVARSIVGNVSFAVTFVGGFVFLSGLLILIGSVAMTKYHRLYESAILKTLGARKKLIVYTTLVEYGVLGLLAGLIGSVAALALSWAISEYGLKIAWHFQPSINLAGIVLTLIVVVTVGVLSSWDVMLRKPLGILRTE